MEESEQRVRRSRKKSKSKDKDTDVDGAFVEKQLKMATKQMERAMRQVEIAKKTAVLGKKLESHADRLERHNDVDAVEQKGIVIKHQGHQIHIGHAENIQVGSYNTMVIGNNGSRSKRSGRHRKSCDSDEEEIVERAADRNREQQEEAVSDQHTEEVLNSERLVTTADLELTSQNVGSDWRRLMRFLGLDDALISQLHQDFYAEGIRQVVFQGLLSWKRQSGREATLGKLTSALKRVGYGSIVPNFKL